MTPAQAFEKLVAMADKARHNRGELRKRGGLTLEMEQRHNDKIHALLIGAAHIMELSGCWSPEDMIWNTSPDACVRLTKMQKEEGL